MFKKFFRGLADSKERKQRARYLESLQEFANQVAAQGAPGLAEIVREVGAVKAQLDESESLEKASDTLGVDFDDLATQVCEQIRQEINGLVAESGKLSKSLASTDPALLQQHLTRWQQRLVAIQQAFGVLRRTGAEKLSPELEGLTEGYDTSLPLGQAMDALMLQVRTAERIRDELGK